MCVCVCVCMRSVCTALVESLSSTTASDAVLCPARGDFTRNKNLSTKTDERVR